MARVFLDTNVLVYAYASADMEKSSIAHRAIREHKCLISPQVINEFCAVCLRKRYIDSQQIMAAIEQISFSCTLFSTEILTTQHAVEIHDRYGFHFYDANIVAAAVECGCQLLFAEDLSDGQRVGLTEIKNIFKTAV